jgi:hypothetical protein
MLVYNAGTKGTVMVLLLLSILASCNSYNAGVIRLAKSSLLGGSTAELFESRRRISAPTSIQVAASFQCAHTIRSLVHQMIETNRYSDAQLLQVIDVHNVAVRLMGSWIRGYGNSLDSHLVGMASVTVAFHQPIQATLFALLHSVSMFGEVAVLGGGDKSRGRLFQAAPSALAKLPDFEALGLDDDTLSLLVRWPECGRLAGEMRCMETSELQVDAVGQSVFAADCYAMRAFNRAEEVASHTHGSKKLERYDGAALDAIGLGTLATFSSEVEALRAADRERHAQLWQAVVDRDLGRATFRGDVQSRWGYRYIPKKFE